METDIAQAKDAVVALFKPDAGLLQRYSRYVEENELEDMQVRFDSLQQDLLLAKSHSDIYEAFCIRNELRELRLIVEEFIALHKSQKSL